MGCFLQRRALSSLIILISFLIFAGCGGGNGNGGGSPSRINLNATSAQEQGNQITDLIAEIVRIAKGSALLRGQLRPGAYPSANFTSKKTKKRNKALQAVIPGCPTITLPDVLSTEGFSFFIDYGTGCIDDFDGVSRSGSITIDVTDITIDLVTGEIITASLNINFTNFSFNGNGIQGSISIRIISLTSETWDMSLTVSTPTEMQSLTFQGALTFSDTSDIETLDGSGTLASSIEGSLDFTLTGLEYDIDEPPDGFTPLICDDPIGGTLVLSGTNSATLTFGIPDPGCGFAFLSIDGGTDTLIPLDVGFSLGADLVISMVDTPDPVAVGSTVTYDISVINNGPDSAHDVVVTVTPTGVAVSSLSTISGNCTLTDQFICTIGTMNPSETTTLSLVVTPTETGTLSNTAILTSTNDSDPSNDITSTITTITTPGFDLTVSPAGATVVHGSTVFYTVNVDSRLNFSSQVTFACLPPLPVGVNCNFNPDSITPPVNGTAQVFLTVNTSTQTPVDVHNLIVEGVSGTLTDSSTVSLTVQHGNATNISVIPQNAIIHEGIDQQFSASVMDNAEHVLPDVPFSWTSNHPNVATVSPMGLATGLGAGGATITVTVSDDTSISGSAPVTVPLPNLAITKAGTDDGTVASSPAGIDCGGTCLKTFVRDEQVTLTATPADGSTFWGWVGGGCSGTGDCTVTMDLAKSVAAIFNGAGGINIINVPGDQPTIQGAIDAAIDGDLVLVSPGSYQENINFSGKAITVMGQEGPEVTTVDGNQTGSVVTFNSGETPASVLTGFSLQNGMANFGGGGIRTQNTSPTIIGNIITSNRAGNGAGIELSFSSAIVQGNMITNNHRGGGSGGVGGGGISIVGSASTQILDNVISNNSIGSWGGGISLFAAGTPTIRNNIIKGNTTFSQGGGIGMANLSDVLIVQNIITDNNAGSGGGIYWLVPSGARGPLLVYNTITGNDGQQGSGIFADGFDVQTELINNIIIGSEGQITVECGNFNDVNPPIFKSNNIFNPLGTSYGGICTDQTGINGNISVDPLFSNPTIGDYHLNAGSPSIETGDNTAPNLPSLDFDGNARILDSDGDGTSVIDMGVYEFIPATP